MFDTNKDYHVKFVLANSQYIQGLKETERKNKSIVDAISRHWKGLAIGATAIAIAKEIMQTDTALRRLRVDTQMSAKEMYAMKEQIDGTVLATGQEEDSIYALSSAAFHASKNINFVRDNMTMMTRVMQASGAPAEGLGEAFGIINRNLGLTGKPLEEFVSNLYSFGQSKAARSTFKDIIPSLPNILNTIKSMAPKASLEQIGQYITASMFVPDPTTFNRFLNALVKGRGGKALEWMQSRGISMKKGELPDIYKLFDSIVKASGNANFQFEAMGKLLRGTGLNMKYLYENWDQYQQAVKSTDVNQALKDSQTIGEGMAGTFTKIKQVFKEIGEKTLAPSMIKLNEAMKQFTPDEMEGLIGALSKMGGVLVTVVEGWGKLFKLMGDVYKIYSNEAKTKGLKEFGYQGFSFIPETSKMPARYNREELSRIGSMNAMASRSAIPTTAQEEVIKMSIGALNARAAALMPSNKQQSLDIGNLTFNVTVDKNYNMAATGISAVDKSGNPFYVNFGK